MGIFGFFLFLSAAVTAYNWRVVRVAQLQRDMLTQLLGSGQQVDIDRFLPPQPVPRPIAFARWKIGTLLILGGASLVVSFVYWEKGTWPLVVAALFALLVARAAWQHERTLAGVAQAGDK